LLENAEGLGSNPEPFPFEQQTQSLTGCEQEDQDIRKHFTPIGGDTLMLYNQETSHQQKLPIM